MRGENNVKSKQKSGKRGISISVSENIGGEKRRK